MDGDERGMYDQQAVCLLGFASRHERDKQHQQVSSIRLPRSQQINVEQLHGLMQQDSRQEPL